MPEDKPVPLLPPLEERLTTVKLRAVNHNSPMGAINLGAAAELAQPLIVNYLANLCVARRLQLVTPPLRIGESIAIGELPPVLPALYFAMR